MRGGEGARQVEIYGYHAEANPAESAIVNRARNLVGCEAVRSQLARSHHTAELRDRLSYVHERSVRFRVSRHSKSQPNCGQPPLGSALWRKTLASSAKWAPKPWRHAPGV
ncbi:hypothetical protein GCM10009860_18050 [Microbacterium mitrae]